MEHKQWRRLGLAVTGVIFLILGITLVLSWWPLVVTFFKGILGMGLAVAGLVMLMLARD